MKLSKLLFLVAVFCFQNTISLQAQQSAPTTEISAEQLNKKLDEVLTLEIAALISGFEATKATKEYENKAAQAFGNEARPPRECIYWWNNSRARITTVANSSVQSPYKDKVGLSRFSNTTLERFKRNYSPLTDAQKETAAKQLQTESAAKGATSDADKKVAETGNQLIATHQAEEIDGVGEAATWYENTNELRVFYNGLTFEVSVDVTNDKAINKAKAIQLASVIIREKLR